ncbi:MAG: replicative DNA helicase [Coriobacteriales bacterium]|jgi:replicative DNA helicase|nr:replicative DNA helicase [Coriobacteriales bacterium]
MPQNDQKPIREDKTPHNLDAEQAALAAMILDREVVEEAVAAIHAEDFFKSAHRTIFIAIQELVEQRTPVDHVTLADKLDAMGKLKDVGGKEYILTLADKSFALANWLSHINIVKNDSLLRDLIKASIKIKALSESSTDDAETVVEEAEKLLFDATEKRVSNTFRPLSDLVIETMDVLDTMTANKGQIFGVPSGFKDLDKNLGGFRSGDLIVLAARTSVGKTALALNVAVNAAKAGSTVAFFSLEMPSQQVVQRLLSAEANVNSWKMRTGNLADADLVQLIQAQNDLGSLRFYIDDSPALSIMELRAKARRLLRGTKDGKGIIIVDYLQLMQPARTSRERQRYLEVGEVSRGLKVLAKELGVPILALSQLSRGVEQRENKRPQLSDLRESGSIEQDADVVLFLDRSKTEEEALEKNRPELNTAHIITGKNRNGALGLTEVQFHSETTRFRDLYRG